MEEKRSNNRLLIAGIVALVLVTGGGIWASQRLANPTVEPTPAATPSAQQPTVPPTNGDVTDSGKPVVVHEFFVDGGDFAFALKEIKVKQGDNVKIVFRNTEGMHDLVIEEYNLRTKVLKAGDQDTIEFVADKAGTFEYYCSVNKHRQMGMVGKLIVE